MQKVARQVNHTHESPRTAETSRASHANLILQRNVFMVFSLFLGTALLLVLLSPAECDLSGPSSNLRDSGRCQVSFGSFKGHQYVSEESGTIGTPKCLVESKWLKLSQHSVRFPGTSEVMDDWLWIDYHDRINVLVEDETKPGEERQFLVFEQSKYALEGKTSLAIIGGIIEPGEDPESAARREVDEEMNGLECENFHLLGRYRTDVNRGMGWLNSFLATKCSRDPNHKHIAVANEIGAADTERQDLKTISLTQLREAARKGQFLEVQWSATVALALQHPDLMV